MKYRCRKCKTEYDFRDIRLKKYVGSYCPICMYVPETGFIDRLTDIELIPIPDIPIERHRIKEKLRELEVLISSVKL